MTAHESRPIVLHVDQDHFGIRLLVPVLLLLGFWLGYLLISALIHILHPDPGGPDYAVLLACVGAMPVGLTIAGAGEFLLKRVWRSGRRLVIDDHGITLGRRHADDVFLDGSEDIVTTKWFFEMKGYPRGGRERHVSSDWFCLACQLQQDEQRIVCYCFLPPKRAVTWTESQDFREIHPADVYETSFMSRLSQPTRPKLPARVISSKDGRFWLAERNRWQEGLELTADDFETLMRHLARAQRS